MAHILCVDDDPGVLVVLEQVLGSLGHPTTLASSVADALELARRESFELIITDYRMPDATGLDLLAQLREAGIETPVIVMTGYATVELAVDAMKRGAADYLTKPLRSEALRIAVTQAIEVHRLKRTNEAYRRELTDLQGTRAIVGESPALRKVLDAIAAVAPTRATVLIEGESGTGKELFARAIHEQSPRADGPFVTVNCAAVPEGLVESAMFGHERGAFTGATTRSTGAFERAHAGSLLLDEISEMRLDLQAKLLRAIQEQEFERVGGSQSVRVDVRLIATTNRDLTAEVEAGRFRRDLFYRLSVVPIHTPPLRERLEDLPALVDHFVRRFSGQLGMKPPIVPLETLSLLRQHAWPGNIRELANALERAVILQKGGRLVIQPLPMAPGSAFLRTSGVGPAPRVEATAGAGASPAGVAASATAAETLNLHELERMTIERALVATGGHRAQAAKLLGISERTLRNKLNPKPGAD
ncbi:MAG TPA: sigma-54 dependent transcriptional regulator [Candidatus Sulfotelmatobacter sp.]|nr:sigma-54 dependent transcriptional regulator [Candidatus Sulfotelmatobacter sp.]